MDGSLSINTLEKKNLFWRPLMFILIPIPFYSLAFILEFSTAALGRHEGL